MMIRLNKNRPLCLSVTLTITLLFSSPHLRAQPVIPFPTPKPEFTGSIHASNAAPGAIAKSASPTAARANTSVSALRSFFEAYDKNDGKRAAALQDKLSSPLDQKIAAWMMATTSTRGFSYQTLRQNQQKVANWPGQDAMRLAQERTLIKDGLGRAGVSALPSHPQTDEGKLLQVHAYLESGDKARAASLIKRYWVSENFTPQQEQQILQRYGALLGAADHKARADRLLYDERANSALRLSRYLSPSDQALVQARIAVIRGRADAGKLLAALPANAKREPGYFFANVQHLRRADKWVEAAKVMMAAPTEPRLLGDADAWWIERRLVSRKVLEVGHPKFAYHIASNHSANGDVTKVDAEFHSGWYALRFLNDPNTALKHFQAIERLSNKPLSRSRAYYWMARAYEAGGNPAQATTHYQKAAQLSYTYYGQLALRALGQNSIALPPLPATNDAKAGFEANPFVQVIRRLDEAGQSGRSGIFYRHLAQTLESPAEITLLAALAEENDLHPLALQIGKLAVARGVDVPRLAFPLGAIPENAGISKTQKALAYAIARQESAFNVAIVSRADARGLMQLLPSTAKQTARQIGVAYKPALLTRDAAYNARLGSAFLANLLERFGGSYPLAFAGYNAGPSRSQEWIARFGDPRKNAIDAIDWVEAIPFSETRNYVQRVMENYQVYRYRLEGAPLTIDRDLNTGTPS